MIMKEEVRTFQRGSEGNCRRDGEETVACMQKCAVNSLWGLRRAGRKASERKKGKERRGKR